MAVDKSEVVGTSTSDCSANRTHDSQSKALDKGCWTNQQDDNVLVESSFHPETANEDLYFMETNCNLLACSRIEDISPLIRETIPTYTAPQPAFLGNHSFTSHHNRAPLDRNNCNAVHFHRFRRCVPSVSFDRDNQGLAIHTTSVTQYPGASQFLNNDANSLIDSDLFSSQNPSPPRNADYHGGQWEDTHNGSDAFDNRHDPYRTVSGRGKRKRVQVLSSPCAAPSSASSKQAWDRMTATTANNSSEYLEDSGMNEFIRQGGVSPMTNDDLPLQPCLNPAFTVDEYTRLEAYGNIHVPRCSVDYGSITTPKTNQESLEHLSRTKPAGTAPSSKKSSWNDQTTLSMRAKHNDAFLRSPQPPVPHGFVQDYVTKRTRGTSQNTPSNSNGARPSADRNLQRDQLLVQYRKMGIPYSHIKDLLGSRVQLSTLRGRYRSLTKPKCQRLRKPIWTQKDIQLLGEAVHLQYRRCQSFSDKRNRDRCSATAAKDKIPWKEVAQYIRTHGGTYAFGNATCKKMWDRVRSAGDNGKNTSSP